MGIVSEARIEHKTLIRTTPERVYDALATGSGLDAWFTTGGQVDARPGGSIRFRWENWGPDKVTAADGGPVLEAVRGERFVFQWSPGGPAYASTVEMTFTPVAEGTVVHLREYGYEDTPKGLRAMLGCATGWGEALALVKFWLEHGVRY